MTGAAFAAGGYALQRGLRYPTLSVSPSATSQRVELSGGQLSLHNLLYVQNETTTLRAYAPEPELLVQLKQGRYRLRVTNLSPRAQLQLSQHSGATVDEQIVGLARNLDITLKQEVDLKLSWKLDSQASYKFAVIGDTGGGGDELDWALTRAQQLDALFLLHLGDFNYSEGEYAGAIKKFSASPVPVYVSIGNHDFHDDGLIYARFRAEINPLNHAFSLAGTQFVNIDTAADFFPASGGLRGDLFDQLSNDPQQYTDRLFFTHRPLRDPRPHDDHIVGGVGEVDWLARSIAALGGDTLLTGHVHHSAELDYAGIKQWTAGEGLGHENIVLQKPVAQMLIGRVAPALPTSFSWVDLNLPWALHTSPTHKKKLVRDNRQTQLAWYETLLEQS